jgi:AbrB family looped-hinge helix DNA binding protein
MLRCTSLVTSQNQISIPSEVRKRFDIHPGTELVWEEQDGELLVRPKRYALEDVQALLSDPPAGPKTLKALREGKIAAATRKATRGRRR